MDTINVAQLTPGRYVILSYEAFYTRFGRTFIIEASFMPDYQTKEDPIRFWSTSYLTNYIAEFQPKKKIYIDVSDGQIVIEGYRRKTVLM